MMTTTLILIAGIALIVGLKLAIAWDRSWSRPRVESRSTRFLLGLVPLALGGLCLVALASSVSEGKIKCLGRSCKTYFMRSESPLEFWTTVALLVGICGVVLAVGVLGLIRSFK